MKIRYLISLLFFSTTFLSAQIWTTEVPYKTTSEDDGVIRDFIKTNDDGFLVLLRIKDSTATFNKFQQTMIKYNASGELEWNRSYDLGINVPNPFTNTGGVFPKNIIQLANDNYLISGITIRDTTGNNPYLFITNSLGDSLSFQTTETYYDIQQINDRIWGLKNENFQQSILSELDEMGNLVGESILENANTLSVLIDIDENVFTKSGNLYRKNSITGEVEIEQLTDNKPNFFTSNEFGGFTAFGDELTKLDADLNVVWDLEYEALFPWTASLFFSPTYEGLIRTQSNDYIIFGSVSDDNNNSIGVYLYKYSKDGDFIWGGVYPFDILPYNYLKGAVEVEDGIVTLGGNRFTNKIKLIKLYPNGLDVPTSTTEIAFKKPNFHVFPNPVSDQLTVEFPEAISGKIQMINAQGKVITTEDFSFSETHRMSLLDYPAGLYVVKAMTEQGVANSQTVLRK